MELRYIRNHSTISQSEQTKLLKATVLIVGLGGLGGYVLEHLARAGVGSICGCDPDYFEESNLNRQLLCTEKNVLERESKALAAKKRLNKINSNLSSDFTCAPFEPTMLAGVDLVLDCLGGAQDRVFLYNSVQKAGLPLITASVAGWVVLVSSSLPLASKHQNTKEQEGNSLAKLMGKFYSRPQALEVEEKIGTLVSAVNMAACIQSTEAIRLLSGHKPSLAGRLLIADLSCMSFRTMNI